MGIDNEKKMSTKFSQNIKKCGR